MCGIAGVVASPSADPVEERELVAMAAMIAHRGPDGSGLFLAPGVGLVNTRLAIVDVEGGAQPLCDESGEVWVAFNGEIFNHVELRGWLEGRGHRFRTRSDTEVIVHAYEELGPSAWEAFNGQFAIGLWDGRTRDLWLVRDRLGIHPLFHAEGGGAVVFGSEVKALLASGRVSATPDPQGLVDTFTRWAPSPPHTVFAGIRQVRPGSAIRFDADLRPTEQRYWRPDFGAAARPNVGAGDAAAAGPSLDDAAEALNRAVEAAIRLRLRADVPVAAYLSGGLDSSYIAALTRRVHGGRLDTFGIRFDDAHFDESAAQRRMAAVLGTDHHEIPVGSADVAAALTAVTWHVEGPLLRTGPIPMFLLSAGVAEAGFKVALTGEGADEWFAGYAIFQEDRVRRFWARDPGSAMRPALLGRIHPEVRRDRQRGGAFWASFFRRGLTMTEAPLYSHLPRWDNIAWTTRLLSEEVRRAGSVEASYRRIEAELPPDWTRWSTLARAQALEIDTFLGPSLLAAQGDRVGLAHGVELRYPFLDPEVADLALRLPDRLKLRGLRDKVVLRRAAASILPRDVHDRPKQPFRAPVPVAALVDPDGPAGPLLDPGAVRRTGLLDPAAVRALVERMRTTSRPPSEREEMALVGAVSLQAWADQFLDSFGRSVDERLRSRAAAPFQVRVVRRLPAPDGVRVAAGTAR